MGCYVKMTGSDCVGWYEADLQNVIQLAGRISAAIDKDQYALKTLEGQLGKCVPITETEFSERALKIQSASCVGMAGELDWVNDKCRIIVCSSHDKEVNAISGAISRLAGIYDNALDQKNGTVNEDQFLSELYRHFALTGIRPASGPSEPVLKLR